MSNKFIDFLESAKFGSILLILSTMLEAFYSYNLFRVTGSHTFGSQTLLVSIIYSCIIAGTIVFFAIRNNNTMVWVAVIFEFAMNGLLDVQTVALSPQEIDNRVWVFCSQLAIGTILPLATKAFANEINKKFIKTRNSYK